MDGGGGPRGTSAHDRYFRSEHPLSVRARLPLSGAALGGSDGGGDTLMARCETEVGVVW